jgi:hypothetical protein
MMLALDRKKDIESGFYKSYPEPELKKLEKSIL